MNTTKCFSFGTDPEFFLKEDNNYVSAVDKVPGSKEQPLMLKSGAGLQTDNVAVEFASKVTYSAEEMIVHLRETFQELQAYMPEGTSLDLEPSAKFSKKELDSNQAQLFGCSPSFNAWTLATSEIPPAMSTQIRTIGAHIHIGENKESELLKDPWNKVHLVRMLDCTLGLFGVLMEDSKNAKNRRLLYGRCGEHRPTPYGVEYRTLGPWWLKNPKTVAFAFSVIDDVLEILKAGKHEEFLNKFDKDTLVDVINNSNVEGAKQLLAFSIESLSVKTNKLFKEVLNNIKKYSFKTSWL